MIAISPALPRPLREGEFYCHKCGEFVAWEKRAEHQKEHERMARGGLA